MQDSDNSGRRADRRKVIKSLGAASLVSLAGCSGGDGGDGTSGSDGGTTGSSGDSGAVEIEFWEYFGGTEQDEITALVDEFNETHDDITVNMSNVPFDEFFDSLFTGVASGNAPHVTTYWMSFSRFMMQEGAIRPIDEQMEASVDDYFESAQPAMQLDGDVYSLPMDIHGNGLIANDTVLEEAGVEEFPTDWQSFQTACDAIKENTDARAFAPLEGGHPIIGMRSYYTALVQEGGSLVEQNGGEYEVTHDGEAGRAAASFLDDVTDEYGWDQPDVQDGAERFGLFMQDELGFILAGNWHVNTFQNEDGEIPDDLEFTFGKPFVFPGGENATFGESTGYFFPADDTHTDEQQTAAVRFAEWVTHNNPLWAQTAAHLPAAKEVGTSEEVTSSKYYDDLGIVETVREMASKGQMKYHPAVPADLYETAIATPFVDVYAQNTEPDVAVEDSAAALRDRLSE